jgi:RNA polymerase sigma-70 factor, ECF subfamily
MLDESAFNTLFKEWYPVLCHFAAKFVGDISIAEDLVQDVFINLWKSRNSLDPETNLPAYLYASTRHNCFHQIKKNQREARILEIQQEKVSDEPEEQSSYLHLIRLKKLYDAVDQLPDKTKQVFVMAKMEGLTYEEIAGYLGVSVKTIEKQMGSALQKLRAEMKSKEKTD